MKLKMHHATTSCTVERASIGLLKQIPDKQDARLIFVGVINICVVCSVGVVMALRKVQAYCLGLHNSRSMYVECTIEPQICYFFENLGHEL